VEYKAKRIGVIVAGIVIGVILTAIGIFDDVANHSITPHLLPLIIGIVLIGVSAAGLVIQLVRRKKA